MACEMPDVLDMLQALPSVEGYAPMDRYRDFKKVFSTDEGKRVLREILSWAVYFDRRHSGTP